MKYHYLTDEERYQLAAMQLHRISLRAIARRQGRSPGTISREVCRNAYPNNGRYRALHAWSMAGARRWRARQASRFGADAWRRVERLIRRGQQPRAGIRPAQTDRRTLHQP